MIADSHMHTKVFSSDASQTPEELIRTAKKLGIHNVSVTEHYDLDYPREDENFTFDVEEYAGIIPEWRRISEELKGPSVHMGIELGWQSHLNDRLASVAASAPFDSILLSVHVMRGDDIYYNEDLKFLPRTERNREYIGLMAKMCREYDDFDIAAHYDYINRYIDDKESSVFYKDCPEEFDDFFGALISKDKSLEINTASIEKQKLKGAVNIMPDPEVIRRYLDMGGKLITIGSDAHKPEAIGINFAETALYLKSLGVKEIFYFERRKPVSDPEFKKI